EAAARKRPRSIGLPQLPSSVEPPRGRALAPLDRTARGEHHPGELFAPRVESRVGPVNRGAPETRTVSRLTTDPESREREKETGQDRRPRPQKVAGGGSQRHHRCRDGYGRRRKKRKHRKTGQETGRDPAFLKKPQRPRSDRPGKVGREVGPRRGQQKVG